MCRALNYFEHFLDFVSAVIGCVSFSAFASLVGALVGIPSHAAGLKTCAITAGIKNYKQIIKKKEKNHDYIVLLAKPELNNIKVWISKALIDSYINHNERVSVNRVWREYAAMKVGIKDLENAVEYTVYYIVSVVRKMLQTKILVSEELNKIN